MKVKCTVEIDDQTIIGVLDSGFAFCTWWEDFKLAERGTDKEHAWAGHVMSGGSVAIVVDDKYGDTGALIEQSENKYTYKLDRPAVEKGLQALANNEKYQHHFSNIVQDNSDAITGDVLIQFALFGEEIFS